MKLRLLIFSILALLSASAVLAQGGNVKDVRRYVKRGNRLIHSGQRDKAYEQYLKAYQADSTDVLVNYNLATSMFPDEWKIMKPDTKRDSVMSQHFLRAADEHAEDNPQRRSMAYYNIGVQHQVRANQSGDDQQKYQQLQQAIECYKQALRNNPHDDEARYNLVLCQRQLPENNNNQQQDQNGDQQQQQQKQDQQQQQQQQQQNQDQQDQQPPQQEQNQDWIEQMLNAAEQREKQVRRRIDENQQSQPQRRGNVKNW